MGEFKWPEGYQSAATFTFDVDASAVEYLAYRNLTGAYSGGDYGPKVGIPRILKLLDNHRMKATFFFPGWVAERFPEKVKEVFDRGHDVAPHGYLHENMASVTLEQEKEIWEKTWRILTRITGQSPKGFRMPGGPMSRETLTIVSGLGAYYGLGTCATYYPYVLKTKSTRNEDMQFACLPFYWLLDDFPMFTWGGVRAPGGASGVAAGNFLAIGSPKEALDYWIKEFDSIHEVGGLFSHVCHPRMIGRASRIRAMDQLITHMEKAGKVWIAGMREIADWVIKTGEVKYIPNYGG